MTEEKMKFNTIEEIQQELEDKVAYLNRLVRQHPKSPACISWLTLKEFIEKELLGYEIKRER
jgi:hypothetical protein